MNKIDFEQNCLLTRYLFDVSMEERGDLKAQFAGALLCELGYPLFKLQFPDIKYLPHLVRFISECGHNGLLSEATERCVHCPHLDCCEVGALIKVG